MSKEGYIRALKMSMTIVGTTIGAGFASGREVWEFFGSYGYASRSSILLSTLLFAAAIIIILEMSRRLKSDNYIQILKPILGSKLTKIFDVFILVYLMTGTMVMFAGSGATFKQLNFSYALGVMILAVAVMLVLWNAEKGLLSLNAILMPILVLVLISVCVHFIMTDNHLIGIPKSNQERAVWPSGVAYTALNIVPLIAVLSTFGTHLRSTSEAIIGGVVGSFVLGSIAVLFNQSLLRLGDAVHLFDIPLLALVEGISPLVIFGVSLVLWLAIYTTAVSNVHGLVSRVSTFVKLPKYMIALIIIVSIIPFTQFGFANLVKVIYPLYGVINLFILFMILLFPLNRTNDNR